MDFLESIYFEKEIEELKNKVKELESKIEIILNNQNSIMPELDCTLEKEKIWNELSKSAGDAETL